MTLASEGRGDRAFAASRGQRLIRSTWLAAALGVILLGVCAGPARAQAITAGPASNILTANGTQLAPLRADPKLVDLTRTVLLGGDVPVATYIAFRPASSNVFFQRNDLGVWVPWDGTPGTLINNGYQPLDGTLTYTVAPIDLSPFLFPLTVIVAYSNGAELKFGQFDVESLP